MKRRSSLKLQSLFHTELGAYFHPYLGKWSNLTNIFQMGWNHQLVKKYVGLMKGFLWPSSSKIHSPMCLLEQHPWSGTTCMDINRDKLWRIVKWLRIALVVEFLWDWMLFKLPNMFEFRKQNDLVEFTRRRTTISAMRIFIVLCHLGQMVDESCMNGFPVFVKTAQIPRSTLQPFARCHCSHWCELARTYKC